MNFQSIHLKLFNLLVRAFGWMSLFCGTGFLFWAYTYYHHPEKTVNVATVSGYAWVDAIGVAGFCFVIGPLVLMVKPFKPESVIQNREPSYEEISKTMQSTIKFVLKTLFILCSIIAVLYFALDRFISK